MWPFLVLVLPHSACDDVGEIVERIENNGPLIDAVVALQRQVAPLDTTTIYVEASDPDGDQLTYSWRAVRGTLQSNQGQSVVWQAPNVAGNVHVWVTVKDEKGKSTDGSVVVAVIAMEKPKVNITAPQDGLFLPALGELRITAAAVHPNGIQEVLFYVNDDSLGVDTVPPYEAFMDLTGRSGESTISALARPRSNPENVGSDTVRVSVEGVVPIGP